MSSNNEIDFTTLNWVKQELEDTLKQARQSLESFVEDPQDASLMRFCASYLHQVQGTLRMVELYGAAMVVEEMERLAQGILDAKVKQSEETYQILMRGMLQVPDYLDRLQSGHRDIPIVLLPLLNDLRACRGEKLLTETALFAPDLSRQLPDQAKGPANPLPEPVLKANAGRLRMAFQLGLLKWFKGEDVNGNTGRLALVLERLQSATTQIDARRLWWTGAGLLDAVRASQVESSVSVKLLVGRVDREIKHLVDSGEAYFAKHPPTELTKNLLYYLAQTSDAGPRVEAIQALYDLGALLPSADELEHARGVMSGANRALLGTVGDAIKEDVLRVKDGLDLFLRGGSNNGAELEPQSDALQRVADTLGMLGLGVPRRLVLDQKDVVDQVVAGRRAAEESTLLDVAGALLYVESSLDDHIARLGRDVDLGGSDEGALELPQAEVRRILEATMKEAQGNVQQAKQDIVAFIESPWDHSKIEKIPQLLEEIGGALRMLNLSDPASLLHGITRFVDLELLKYRRVPSGEQLDLLADALASIEYYMEALRDQRGGRDKILDVTRRSLEELGYWPVPEMVDDAEPQSVEETAETAADADASKPATEQPSEFPSFGGDFSADTSEAELSAEDAAEMPSIELPPIEPVQPEVSADEDTTQATAEDDEELRSAVEIAPGEGLESLIVGDSAEEPTAPSSTSVDGLSFDQTELESDAPAEPTLDPEQAVEQTLLSAADGEPADAGLDFDFDLSSPDDQAPVEAAHSDAAEPAQSADSFGLDFEPPPAAEAPDGEAKVAEQAPSVESELALEPIAEPTDASVVEPAEVDSETASAEVQPSLEDSAELSLEFDAAADTGPSEIEPADLSESSEPAALEESSEAPVEAAVEAPDTAPPAAPAAGGPPQDAFALPDASFQAVPSDEIDEEIREVFVEEVQDELDNLNSQYPAWVADQSDSEKLKPVRRSFHTLKGSGRLVGALAIGEFSWKIENMLNRLLDKTIDVSPALLDLMDNAIAALPELLAALRDEGPPKANIGAMMWCADRLAAGEEAWLPKAEPVPSPAEATEAAQRAGEIDADQEASSSAGAEPEAQVDSEGAEAVAPVASLDESDDGESPDADSAEEDLAPSGYGAESPLGGDPMLREILRSEVAAHLQTIRQYLEEWYEHGEPSVVSEDLLRAVHTLNGAVSMVDLPAIAGLVAPLEGYLKRARGHDLTLDRRAADLLTESADCIDDCMEQLEAENPLPDLTELTDAVIALKDDMPAIDRGYQAFGIQLSEEIATTDSETLVDDEDTDQPDAESTAATEPLELQEQEDEQGAVERPWYEAEVDDELGEEIDELIDATDGGDDDGAALQTSAADELDSETEPTTAKSDSDSESGSEQTPWYEVPEAEALEAEAAEAELESVEDDDQADAPAELLDTSTEDAAATPLEVEEFAPVSEIAEVSELPESSEMGADTEGDSEVIEDLAELGEMIDSDDQADLDLLADSDVESDGIEALAELGELIDADAEIGESEPLDADLADVEQDSADDSAAAESDEASAFAALDDIEDGATALEAEEELLATTAADSSSDDLAVEGDLLLDELEAMADGEDLTPSEESQAQGFADLGALEPGASGETDADAAVGDLEVDVSLAEPTEEAGDLAIEEGVELEELAALADADTTDQPSAAADEPATLDLEGEFVFEPESADVPLERSIEAEAEATDAEASEATVTEEEVSEADVTELEVSDADLTEAEVTDEVSAADAASSSTDDDWSVPELDFDLTEGPEQLDEAIRFDTVEAQFSQSQTAQDEDAAPADDAVAEAEIPAEFSIEAEAEADEELSGSEEEAEVEVAIEAEEAPIAAESHAEDPIAAAARPRMPVDEHPDRPMDSADLDPELLDIFLQEGTEILDLSDGLMARLRQTPEDREIVTELQRELHTLKGGARMAGLAPIGDLSHAMESLFEAVTEGRTSNAAVQHIEILEHAFDSLHRMVQRVQQGRAIASPDATIDVLDQLIRGEAPTLPVASVATPDEPAAATEAVETAAEPATEAEPTTVPPPPRVALRRTKHDEEEPGQRIQQEVIRVRADLIDNLVNFAGEVSIYRSRLEAQIGGFRFNLVEFDQTVTRLREQLRKLEMETEAQILSRYQREMEHLPGDPEFDPLELDRFSTLQQLSRALAESVSDLMSLQNLMDDIARQSETLLLQQSRVSSDLQEGLMRTRMVPFESLVPRLRRIMRQTTGELGKRAQLKVEGAQGEMDRTVLERMTAPMEHMLRNALAHGLETPAQRAAVGKPEEGTVSLIVSRDATEVVIRVVDDGRGMDRDAIRAKAIERGLLREDTVLSDRDLYQFVLETGFSTAQEVSKIAGRGVGMDVVNSEIKQLGGSLQIDSERGKGTTFIVRLPFTLAVTQAILVKLADVTFAVPMTSIQGVMRINRKDLERRIKENELEVVYAGETYQIYDLGELLGNPVTHTVEEGQIPLLMTRTGDQRGAIRISSVVGSREVVVKSVGPQLSAVPGFFGATIMGDGSVVVILDLAPLVRHGAALRQAPELAAELEIEQPAAPPPVRRAPLVMVVDDSITMRKVTSRVLERNELDVVTAKDGMDAVEQLQDKIPDVMLLDIEMPRMDGYELATYMKNDPRLRQVPIIMITSRTGEKHRQRALEIGVERYLGKPYQEGDLLKNVHEALGQGVTDGAG